MTDHKLLELAAKAAGMPNPWDANDVFTAWIYGPEGLEAECGHWWDPAADDGDSRRLQVAVGLSLSPCVGGWLAGHPEKKISGYDSIVGECPRRVVLIAAAEIGRAMP